MHKKTGQTNWRETKAEKLHRLFNDGRWHATKELARRVGHTFAVAKFKLVGYGHVIEREKHPTKRYQYRYRLTDSPAE